MYALLEQAEPEAAAGSRPRLTATGPSLPPRQPPTSSPGAPAGAARLALQGGDVLWINVATHTRASPRRWRRTPGLVAGRRWGWWFYFCFVLIITPTRQHRTRAHTLARSASSATIGMAMYALLEQTEPVADGRTWVEAALVGHSSLSSSRQPPTSSLGEPAGAARRRKCCGSTWRRCWASPRRCCWPQVGLV
jgi:hypothetical protein